MFFIFILEDSSNNSWRRRCC